MAKGVKYFNIGVTPHQKENSEKSVCLSPTMLLGFGECFGCLVLVFGWVFLVPKCDSLSNNSDAGGDALCALLSSSHVLCQVTDPKEHNSAHCCLVVSFIPA